MLSYVEPQHKKPGKSRCALVERRVGVVRVSKVREGGVSLKAPFLAPAAP